VNRFVALAWNAHDAAQVSAMRQLTRRLETAFPELRPALECPDLAVYCTLDEPRTFAAYPLPGDAGVVVGKVFCFDMDGDHVPRPVQFDEHAAAAAIARHGRNLFEQYWGGYVAFLRDSRTGAAHVLRDPSGAIACHVTRHRGLSVVFSEVEDCVALGIALFAINWRYVAAWLVQPYLQIADTGLENVMAVRPGECVTLQDGAIAARALLWNIAELADSEPIEEVSEAVNVARRSLRAAIGAWASCHPRVVCRLSGGLDSSVVLACLLRAPSNPEITCLNYFDRTAAGDERAFARLAWEGAQTGTGRHCELIERLRTPDQVPLDSVVHLARSPTPGRYLGFMAERHDDRMISCERRAVIFSGIGGDPIFFRFSNDAAAIDYVHRHGLGRDFPRVVFENARMAGTVWSVAWRAIRLGLFDRQRPYTTIFLREASLLDPAVHSALARNEDEYLVPEWLRAARADVRRRLSPEKLKHLDTMSIPWHVRDPFPQLGEVRWVTPLASQPVIEAFARMPLSILTTGSQDRAIARRALEPDLPARLLARRSKGLLNTFYMDVIRQNMGFFRSVLLDGVLASEGLLERSRLESALRSCDDRSRSFSALTRYFDMEIWLSSWLRRSQPRQHAQG